jgi:adenosine deaminase
MTQTASPDLADFIRRLPKTENHLHIEGAVPYEFLQRINPDKFRELPPFWAEDYRFSDFMTFINTFMDWRKDWFTSPERYYESCQVALKHLHDQGARYLETSFHLRMASIIGCHPREIIQAILAAAPPGLEVRVFAGMWRNHYVEPMREWIDDMVNWDDLSGVDFDGPEDLPLEPWALEKWALLRRAGKVTKAHAGELEGAHLVRESVVRLGATRIQHGIRAIEDPAVVQLLIDKGTVLDLCPTSNVKLKVVPSYEAHPARALFDAGVAFTINTDGPIAFGASLNDEYTALAVAQSFSKAELAAIAKTGFQYALLPESEKQRHVADIDRLIAEG